MDLNNILRSVEDTENVVENNETAEADAGSNMYLPRLKQDDVKQIEDGLIVAIDKDQAVSNSQSQSGNKISSCEPPIKRQSGVVMKPAFPKKPTPTPRKAPVEDVVKKMKHLPKKPTPTPRKAPVEEVVTKMKHLPKKPTPTPRKAPAEEVVTKMKHLPKKPTPTPRKAPVEEVVTKMKPAVLKKPKPTQREAPVAQDKSHTVKKTDAENVSQKEVFGLDGAKRGLAFKEIPKVLTKDPCKLHFMGLSEKTMKDAFLSYLELVSDEDISSVLFGSNFNVMVTFKKPPDLGKIQQRCRSRPLDGSQLKVEQVSICDCITVSGLRSNTTRDTILYYFENSRKSGGGDVKKVDYVYGETNALVFFEQPSDVDKVLANEHVINGATLQVVPHYPFLGVTSEEPAGREKKEKKLNADPQAIAFIDNFFKKEFEDLLQRNEVRLYQKQGKDDVVLVSNNSKIDKAKWNDSCEVIERYINQITTHETVASSASWEETVQQAKQTFSKAPNKIHLVFKEEEQRILLRGKKQDVDALAKQLENLIKEIVKKIKYEKDKIGEKIDLTNPQLDLLNFVDAIQKVKVRLKDLEVRIDKKGLAIHLRGTDSVVKEGNMLIWQYLSKMKEQEMELSSSVVNILTSDEGNVFVSKQFKDQHIEAVITSSDDNDGTKLIITAVDQLDVNKAIDFIKKTIVEDSVPLTPDQNSLILSIGWKKMINEFKKYKLCKVTTVSKRVRIYGIKEEVNTYKKHFLKFLEENTIFIVPVEVDAVRTKCIHRFKQDEVTKIEDEFKQHSVHINQNSNGEGFAIHGTKEGTEKATKKVLQLVSQVRNESIEIEKPGIKKLFSESKGQKLLSNIESDHMCIIERLSDENNVNTAGGNAAVAAASQTDQICSYVTPTGKKITILKGDLTEFKVDVMVNVTNSRLQHVGGLAGAIVVKGGKQIQDECDNFISRQNELLDGEVFVSSPGKLPCQRIVHTVGPRWNDLTKQYEEQKRILMQTVFNALEKADNFTSIAIPAIRSFGGFPIDLCAKTMLASVSGYLEITARVKLSEIYIIDMDDYVTQAFYEEMKSRFGKENSFTDSVTTADVGNIPRRRRTSQIPDIKMSIVVGDLAEEMTHAIVNTVASDLDLSKNPCAKALSNAAGPQLQKACEGKGHLKPGCVLVTEGYKLGCKNVFHVVAGDWKNGNGEKFLRALIVSCLKEADKQGFSNIAFPAIGTGNLGFPRDIVAKVFFEEVISFKKKHQQTSVLEVRFVLFRRDQPTIDAFQKEQKNWSKHSKGKRQSQPFEDCQKAFINSVSVDLVLGDITKESTDAIVTPSNQTLDLAQSGDVGAAIARAGGPSIQKECDKLGPQTPGSVVCTCSGNLPSHKLFHLNAASFGLINLADVVLKCLKMAETQGISSIAIPAVGTGNAKLSPQETAKALSIAVEKFCMTKPKSLQHIRIVVFQEHMLEDFHRAIEELEKTKSSSGSSVKFKSWFKSVFRRREDKMKTQGPTQFDVGDVDGVDVGKASYSLHRQMFLKVFASSMSNLKEANTAIKELIKEQTNRKVIVNPAIEGLSQTQEEHILRLQEKYLTEIEIQKHLFKIIISGLSEDVADTVVAVYEILNEKTEAEHERRYAELVSTTVQWYYGESAEREPYDDITNAKIEKAFKEKNDSVMITLVDENDKEVLYTILFATMKETNLDTGDETDVHREEHGKGIQLPHHWDAQPNDANGKEKDILLVQLDPAKNQQEYDGVLAAAMKSSAINIVKIERVQNPELYRAYMVKKQKMDDKDGSNEKKLFHGTAVDTCSLINHKGFNRSYCGKNATHYGKGVYFARDASYSMQDKYSSPDPNGYRCMYLASVLVGQFTVGNRNMIAPPPKDPNNATITYDTTVNDVNDPQLFVAYHDNQVNPEYLITFM